MKLTEGHKEKIREKFSGMQTKDDLLILLNEAKQMLYGEKSNPVSLKTLSYYANPSFCERRYTSFKINKKSGGVRSINAPVQGLRTILRVLNVVLQCVYDPHKAATGFVLNKSIVDNAKAHIGRTYVFNLDLKDFFHSFDRNRVKMGFYSKPFNLKGDREPLAFFLACLCTHPFEVNDELKTILPQGSPTSPTITNILCRTLDRRLNGLAKRFHLKYTRYADDITFSGHKNVFKKKKFQAELKRIIEIDQDLRINPLKTRLQKSGNKQEATGLTVNEKVNVPKKYVKQLRMWLNFWEKYGYAKAEHIFKRDYSSEKAYVQKNIPSFSNVLDGKLQFLGMVKGTQDPTYSKLRERFTKLENSLTKTPRVSQKALSRFAQDKKAKDDFTSSAGEKGFQGTAIGLSYSSIDTQEHFAIAADPTPEYSKSKPLQKHTQLNIVDLIFEKGLEKAMSHYKIELNK